MHKEKFPTNSSGIKWTSNVQKKEWGQSLYSVQKKLSKLITYLTVKHKKCKTPRMKKGNTWMNLCIAIIF
jgi:hypothetical protein